MSLNTWLRILDKHFQKDGEIFLEILTPNDLFGDSKEPAPHPLDGMLLSEMIEYILELKMKYSEYDLFFQLMYGPDIFGDVNWWELRGVLIEPIVKTQID
jgi:hypothetical protein